MESIIAGVIAFILVAGIPIVFIAIGALCAAHTYGYDTKNICNAVEEARQRKEEKIAAFWGTPIKSSEYNNPSNITDDAFLLFVGEQKLAFGHPESAKSFGEEW